jgi:hypothetical protein
VTLAVHPGWAYYRLLHGFEPGDAHTLFRIDRSRWVTERWTGSDWEPIDGVTAAALYRKVNTGDPSFDPIEPHEAMEETTPRDINKYSPDQPRDDHGRFGESDSAPGDTAPAIVAGAAQGGFTVHPYRATIPKTGYQVAIQGRTALYPDSILKDTHALHAAVADFVAKNADMYHAGGKYYIGGWPENGQLYLDVSERVSDRAEAVRLGGERNQIAIWDNAKGVPIDTGGTGT